MNHIDYFKLQAKNLLRDYKTQFRDESGGGYLYKPRFFDVDRIVKQFDIDEEENFSLMNAQHFIAHLAGFRKWTDLIKATEPKLELSKLIFDNRERINITDWELYVSQNLINFDDKAKLEIFKKMFLSGDESEKTVSNRKRTITDLEEMLYIDNNIFGTAYDYLFAQLEDWYISKSDGVERILTELDKWDSKAEEVIGDTLVNNLMNQGIHPSKLMVELSKRYVTQQKNIKLQK